MLEDLLSNEFIIPINDHINFVGFAELVGRHIQVGHCHGPLFVDDYLDLLGGEVVRFNVLFHKGARIILGCIVDEDNPVVLVVLLDDGIHVVRVPVAGHILVAGYNYTEGQFSIL